MVLKDPVINRFLLALTVSHVKTHKTSPSNTICHFLLQKFEGFALFLQWEGSTNELRMKALRELDTGSSELAFMKDDLRNSCGDLCCSTFLAFG